MINDTRRETQILVSREYIADVKYGIINVDTRYAPATITLPNIRGSGIYGVDDNRLIIVDYYNNAHNNPITIQTWQDDTINGFPYVTIQTAGGGYEIIPTGLTTYVTVSCGNYDDDCTVLEMVLIRDNNPNLIDLSDESLSQVFISLSGTAVTATLPNINDVGNPNIQITITSSSGTNSMVIKPNASDRIGNAAVGASFIIPGSQSGKNTWLQIGTTGLANNIWSII